MSAEASLSGYTIRVQLTHSHPFLAEYTKKVLISKDGSTLVSKEFQDSGGLANFYVLGDGHSITVVDGVKQGIVLDTTTGATTDIDLKVLPEDYLFQSSGQFLFDENRNYRWMTDDELPAWAKRKPIERPAHLVDYRISAADFSRAAPDQDFTRKYFGKTLEVEGVVSSPPVAYEQRTQIVFQDSPGIECVSCYADREVFKMIPVGQRIKVIGEVVSIGADGALLFECVLVTDDRN